MHHFYDILISENLADKLSPPPQKFLLQIWEGVLPQFPGRTVRHLPSGKKLPFPSIKKFSTVLGRAQALHSFANHELQAIEMMSYAILRFPHKAEWEIQYKKNLISALKDEQIHFMLYQNRLLELGFCFGDFPLNWHLWNRMRPLNSLQEFAALMSLTFETANLDFALDYQEIFRSVGDETSADILKRVHQDEILHVAFGHKALLASLEDNGCYWDTYCKQLPFGMTPAHARGGGKHFDEAGRIKARLPQEFIQQTKKFPRKRKL